MLNEDWQQVNRSYGCSDSIAFFVSDEKFYVFDSKVGSWQEYDYGFPEDFSYGLFYPKDDYILFVLLTSDYYADIKNAVYSSYTSSFNMIEDGCYITQPEYDHGYCGIKDENGSGDEYLLVGYSAFDNQFDVFSYTRYNESWIIEKGGIRLHPVMDVLRIYGYVADRALLVPVLI